MGIGSEELGWMNCVFKSRRHDACQTLTLVVRRAVEMCIAVGMGFCCVCFYLFLASPVFVYDDITNALCSPLQLLLAALWSAYEIKVYANGIMFSAVLR
jgi:hypothetical protein